MLVTSAGARQSLQKSRTARRRISSLAIHWLSRGWKSAVFVGFGPVFALRNWGKVFDSRHSSVANLAGGRTRGRLTVVAVSGRCRSFADDDVVRGLPDVVPGRAQAGWGFLLAVAADRR